MYETNPVLNGIVAFLTGILSGFGIGGGTLLIIYLSWFAGVEQRIAQFMNLIYFLPTSLGSMIPHIKKQRIDWGALIPTAITGCVTAYIASLYLRTIDVSLLKRIFGLFLLFIGVKEVTAKK